jgi:flagellin
MRTGSVQAEFDIRSNTMLSILNSVSSLQAENAISNTTNALNTNLEQLSTGLRINNGSDDAAGLSIVNGLQANIAGLSQSSLNANDGVGMLQTADGALSQVTALLDRAVTLATEASNGGLSTTQATALQTEYAAIQAEINNIGTTTDFNGTAVFGSTGSVFESDGTTSSTISTAVAALSSKGLGLTTTGTPLSTASGAQAELTLIDAAVSTVAGDRGTIGATVNQLTASQSVESAAVTNLTSAEDSIQNADVGKVVAEMTQNSVLEQTGMAALSQSNQMQQNVLKLVQ